MSQDRPNILYIMDDQHRWDYLGSMGADFVKTHKLVENQNDINELYDLENDPNELNNIARENPDIATKLSRRLGERFTEGAWLRG